MKNKNGAVCERCGRSLRSKESLALKKCSPCRKGYRPGYIYRAKVDGEVDVQVGRAKEIHVMEAAVYNIQVPAGLGRRFRLFVVREEK